MSRRLQGLLRILRQRIGGLRALREEISAARRVVARCRGCTNVPNSRGCPHCPVREQRADINVFDLLRD